MTANSYSHLKGEAKYAGILKYVRVHASVQIYDCGRSAIWPQ